jgi:DNA-binding transcriptional MerR regulator
MRSKSQTGERQEVQTLEPQAFTSADVIDLTGITARQLQWWDERKIVVPQRRGRNRVYSVEDLAEVAVICELRNKGFSLQRVRQVMRYLQRELGKRLVETVTSGSEYHLLTDGKRIYLENSERQIVDLLKNSRQPLLSICLTDAVQEIHAQVRKRNGVRRTRGGEERSRQSNRRRLRRIA